MTEPTDARERLTPAEIERMCDLLCDRDESVTALDIEALRSMALRTAEAEREAAMLTDLLLTAQASAGTCLSVNGELTPLGQEIARLEHKLAAAERALGVLVRREDELDALLELPPSQHGDNWEIDVDEARRAFDAAFEAARAVLAGKPSEAKDAALSIDDYISVWSMRPQPGTPTGDAWEAGARQGWQWRDAALKGSHD